MRRIIAASVVGAAALSFAPAALASSPTRAHLRAYHHAYHVARAKFGARAVGCNLTERRGSCHRKVSDEKVVASLAVLNRMLAPPPSFTTVTALPTRNVHVYATQAASPVTGYSSGGACGGITPYAGGGQCWAIPYSVVKCESGGQNVPNSQGSGAQGYYQLVNGGTGSRSQQDQAAAALWNHGAGASNWVCKG